MSDTVSFQVNRVPAGLIDQPSGPITLKDLFTSIVKKRKLGEVLAKALPRSINRNSQEIADEVANFAANKFNFVELFNEYLDAVALHIRSRNFFKKLGKAMGLEEAGFFQNVEDTNQYCGPLVHAIDMGNRSAIKLLVALGTKLDALEQEPFMSPLSFALDRPRPSTKTVELLLKLGADPNIGADHDYDSGNTNPLLIVINNKSLSKEKRKELVEILIKHKVELNPTEDEDTPLTAAIKNLDFTTVQQLLKAGADPNLIANGESSLTVLLDSEPDIKPSNDKTYAIFRLLISAKANPEAKVGSTQVNHLIENIGGRYCEHLGWDTGGDG